MKLCVLDGAETKSLPTDFKAKRKDDKGQNKTEPKHHVSEINTHVIAEQMRGLQRCVYPQENEKQLHRHQMRYILDLTISLFHYHFVVFFLYHGDVGTLLLHELCEEMYVCAVQNSASLMRHGQYLGDLNNVNDG